MHADLCHNMEKHAQIYVTAYKHTQGCCTICCALCFGFTYTHTSLHRREYVLPVLAYETAVLRHILLLHFFLPLVDKSWVQCLLCKHSANCPSFQLIMPLHFQIKYKLLQPSHLTRQRREESSAGLNSCDVFPLPLPHSSCQVWISLCECACACVLDFHVCIMCVCTHCAECLRHLSQRGMLDNWFQSLLLAEVILFAFLFSSLFSTLFLNNLTHTQPHTNTHTHTHPPSSFLCRQQ